MNPTTSSYYHVWLLKTTQQYTGKMNQNDQRCSCVTMPSLDFGEQTHQSLCPFKRIRLRQPKSSIRSATLVRPCRNPAIRDILSTWTPQLSLGLRVDIHWESIEILPTASAKSFGMDGRSVCAAWHAVSTEWKNWVVNHCNLIKPT